MEVRKCAGRAPRLKAQQTPSFLAAQLDAKNAWSAAAVTQMRPMLIAARSQFLAIGWREQVPAIVSTILATE
jgi:hypothetical protein